MKTYSAKVLIRAAVDLIDTIEIETNATMFMSKKLAAQKQKYLCAAWEWLRRNGVVEEIKE